MNESDILDKVGRRDGIAAPEGYFENFTREMMAMLPADPAPRNTLWLRVRPYVYMAAMFAGIFCMMKMFSMMKAGSADLNIENYPTLTATLEAHEAPYEVIDEMDNIDEYDIIEDLCNDGYTAEDFFAVDEDTLQEAAEHLPAQP